MYSAKYVPRGGYTAANNLSKRCNAASNGEGEFINECASRDTPICCNGIPVRSMPTKLKRARTASEPENEQRQR